MCYGELLRTHGRANELIYSRPQTHSNDPKLGGGGSVQPSFEISTTQMRRGDKCQQSPYKNTLYGCGVRQDWRTRRLEIRQNIRIVERPDHQNGDVLIFQLVRSVTSLDGATGVPEFRIKRSGINRSSLIESRLGFCQTDCFFRDIVCCRRKRKAKWRRHVITM